MIPKDLYGNPIGYLTGQALLIDDEGKPAPKPAATPADQEHPTDTKIKNQYNDLAATGDLFDNPNPKGTDK